MKRKVSVVIACLIVVSMVSFSAEVVKKLSVNFLGIEANQVDTIIQGQNVYMNINKLAALTNNEVVVDGDTVKFVRKNNILSDGKILGSTRTNPAKIGDTVVVRDKSYRVGEYELEMTLLDIIRGDEAEKIIIEGNKFNDKTDENHDYILAKFKIHITYTENDKPLDINSVSFDSVNSNGVEYSEFYSVSGLKNEINRDMYQGSTFEGWTYFLVEKDDVAPKAVFNRNGDISAWFEMVK